MCLSSIVHLDNNKYLLQIQEYRDRIIGYSKLQSIHNI